MTRPAASHLRSRVRAVFLDLDGTLVDTAPDMVAVLRDMQLARAMEPVPYSLGRSHVSNGAIGLLRLVFPDAADDGLRDLHAEYLDRYQRKVCLQSILFSGMAELLDELDELACPWGVVTNKPARLTEPLLAALGLLERAACVVSGDTLPQRKPDPAPLLRAAESVRTRPQHAVYVGDASRDVQAGRAARMATVAAAYGYIVPGDDPAAWGADSVVADTGELAQILLKAVTLHA